ncbi:MAG: ABC transporter substrate-binding protein [Lachnospiraceae bacterium]|nr:ABC transporter substrate-binding protein [Lachnospiraceae bacterium]
MKKKAALMMAAMMAAASLAGCGGGSAETNQTEAKTEAKADESAPAKADAAAGGDTMTVAWWGNQIRNERTQAALDKYSELNPGVTFDGQFSEWNDYWNKLATAAAGHSLPDVIQMDYSYIDQYAKNNLLVDLTPYVEDGTLNLDNCSEEIIKSGMVDGKLYGIPSGVNAPAMVYNKTITDQAGVEIKDNMTLDEFREVCKTIYEKTGCKTNVAYGVSQEIFSAFVRGVDSHILFDDGKLGVENAEELIPYFALYEDGVKEGWYIDPGVFAEITSGSVEQDPLVYGSSPETMSWCAFCWSNQYAAFTSAAPETMDLELSTWPSFDPKKSNFLKPAQFYSVTVDAKDPAAAVKVLDYLTNSMDANNILLGERGVPVSSKVAEELAPQLSENEQKIITFINEVITPNSSTINPPYPNGTSEVADLINQLEEKVCYGEMTAAEAAQELYTKGNEFMAAKKAN